jgi:ubiquinol-cytochrome c reductase iron-sulfur subunit
MAQEGDPRDDAAQPVTANGRPATRAMETIVAVLLAATSLASIAFAIVYAFGAQTQLAAAFLCLAFGTLAAAMVVYEHNVMPHHEAIEERGSLPSGQLRDAQADDAFMDGVHDIVGSGGRRRWLVAVFGGAVTSLGVALLFPFRSFAPPKTNADTLAHTNWKAGSRAVREDGTLVHASDLEVNSVLTVFPEGHTGPAFADAMTNDATVLVRVPTSELRLPTDRATWAPDGLIALSKVCTHAGCPVGLYRAAARQLFCPCHQSTFDVLAGGERVFGPAARGLPQLPLQIASDGSVEARGDYPEPIGPTYWERT